MHPFPDALQTVVLPDGLDFLGGWMSAELCSVLIIVQHRTQRFVCLSNDFLIFGGQRQRSVRHDTKWICALKDAGEGSDHIFAQPFNGGACSGSWRSQGMAEDCQTIGVIRTVLCLKFLSKQLIILQLANAVQQAVGHQLHIRIAVRVLVATDVIAYIHQSGALELTETSGGAQLLVAGQRSAAEVDGIQLSPCGVHVQMIPKQPFREDDFNMDRVVTGQSYDAGQMDGHFSGSGHELVICPKGECV